MVGIVYAHKLLGLKIWYIDNLIKIYFVWNVVCILVLFIGAVVMSLVLKNINIADMQSQKKQDEYKKYVESQKAIDSLTYKVSRILTLLLDVGYGVIGCWWFFGINMFGQVAEYLFYSNMKSVVVKLREISPELKAQAEAKIVKSNKKLESKFTCIVAAK